MCELKILKNGTNLYVREMDILVPYAEKISLIQFTLCKMEETHTYAEITLKHKEATQNLNWKQTMEDVFVYHATTLDTQKELKINQINQ